MQIGVCLLPTSPGSAAHLAGVAEVAGLEWLGIADSPQLFGAMYPAIQHALLGTERIRIGPFVTNPVTRHPSVHAADLSALDGLAPGRVFLAIGTGDSAVHSVGLQPARPDQLAAAVNNVRQAVGPRLPMLVAVSGPRAAAACPHAADGVVLGGGLDAGWLSTLAEEADQAAAKRLARWVYLPSHLVSRSDDASTARRAIRQGVIAFSRHGLAGDKRTKGVPEHLIAGLEEMYAKYNFSQHAIPGSSNGALLARYPEQEQYLFDRFGAVGSPEQVAAQLAPVLQSAGIDGVFLGAAVPDQVAHLELIAGELQPLLRDQLSAGGGR